MHPNTILCGTYRVPETTVFRYAGYECAAWWKDIQVETGEYPVYCFLEASTLHFTVDLPGVIVADNFQSLYCGNRIGAAYDETQNAGKPASYSIYSQDYCVFGSMNDRDKSPWNIDLSVLSIKLDTCSDCGGIITWNPSMTRCPSCSVKRSNERRNHTCRRHRFLLTTGYGLRTSRDSSYLDSVIAEAYADQGPMADFYRKILVAEVRSMRAAGPRGRIAARNRYPTPAYTFNVR